MRLTEWRVETEPTYLFFRPRSGGDVELIPSAALGLNNKFGSLLIADNSKLDIGNTTLIIDNVPDETVIGGYLVNGFNAGNWDGGGNTGPKITSLTANMDAEASVGFGNSADFTFDGSNRPYAAGGSKAMTGNQVVVKPALNGDLLLTDSVNANELSLLLNNYNMTPGPFTWAYGNIDYSTDGLVGASDLLLLTANYRRTKAY